MESVRRVFGNGKLRECSPSRNTMHLGSLNSSGTMPTGTSEARDAVDNASPALSYQLRFLGTTLVDEPIDNDTCARAVKRIINMSRKPHQRSKTKNVVLSLSSTGIEVVEHGKCDSSEEQLHLTIDIFRVAHCAVDNTHGKVFAFISRNTINNTLECFAFHCGKRQTAQVVCLSLAHAFQSVYQQECTEEQYEKTRSLLQGSGISRRSQSIPVRVKRDCPYSTVSLHTPPDTTSSSMRSGNGDYLMDFSDCGYLATSCPGQCGFRQDEEVATTDKADSEAFDELARGRVHRVSESSLTMSDGSNNLSASVSSSASSDALSHTSSPSVSHHSLRETDRHGLEAMGLLTLAH